MLKRLIITYILLCCIVITASADVERFTIKSDNNPDYLPYEVTIIDSSDHSLNRITVLMRNMVSIYKTGLFKEDKASFVQSHNPGKGIVDNPRFSFVQYPPARIIRENPVGFNIADWRFYYDKQLQKKLIIATGIIGDSILVYSEDPQGNILPDKKRVILICDKGQSETLLKTGCIILAISNEEAFLYLDNNKLKHKRLYCIDLKDLKIKWFIDNTSAKIYTLTSQTEKYYFLTTITPKNGYITKEFDDKYAYFAVINNEGKVINKKILSLDYYTPLTSSSSDSSFFFISHEIRPADSPDEIIPKPDSFFISRLDRLGNFEKTIAVSEYPYQLFYAPYKSKNDLRLFVLFKENIMRVYDDELLLIAEYSNFPYSTYFGTLQIEQQDNPVYIFTDGLYNYDFQKLLEWPYKIFKKPESLTQDELGNTKELLLQGVDFWGIASIKRKSTLDLLTVFYLHNQKYILMVLSGLLVGLLLTSIYQRRTKNNLNLITSQNVELEKTHQQLKEMQYKLIEAEKYKQAKDIAGGFAHEIRNALFPVDGSLNKLFKLNNQEQYDKEKLEKYYNRIKSSTNRAITMTELISQYTKLDSAYLPEVVNITNIINEVIDTNQTRIDEQHVEIKIESDSDHIIESNNQQLFIVLNNLLLNSLDALTNRDNCLIFIKLWADRNSLHLSFEDNGVGINLGKVDKIFDTFFSTKPTKGTGIGLSMVKKIIEMYHGTIKVSSIENSKTTFEITFKLLKR